MLTKGAIGNLVNRYRAVLKKCNLMNTFGSLAVASMLVLGGAGVAGAAEVIDPNLEKTLESYTATNGENYLVRLGKDFSIAENSAEKYVYKFTVNVPGGGMYDSANPTAYPSYRDSYVIAHQASLEGTGITFDKDVEVEFKSNSGRNFTGQGGSIAIRAHHGTIEFARDLTLQIISEKNANGSAMSVTGLNAWGLSKVDGEWTSDDSTKAAIALKGNTLISITGGDESEGVEYKGDKTMKGKPTSMVGISINEQGTVATEAGKTLTLNLKSEGTTETTGVSIDGGGYAQLDAHNDFNIKSTKGIAYGMYVNNSGWTYSTGSFQDDAVLSVTGDVNMTITGGERAIGLYAEDSVADNSTIATLASKNININATSDGIARGVIAKKSKVKLGGDSTESIAINIKGGEKSSNTSIGLWAWDKDADLTVKTGKLSITGSAPQGTEIYGVIAQTTTDDGSTPEASRAHLTIDAAETTISLTDGTNPYGSAIVAMSEGIVDITKGDLYATAENAILARGNAKALIGSEATKTVLEGNINFNWDDSSTSNVDAIVDVTLGKDSSWTGNSLVSWDDMPTASAGAAEALTVKQLTLTMHEGSVWTPTVIEAFENENTVNNKTTYSGQRPLAVNKLTMNDGIVAIKSGVNAKVDTLAGDGGEIRMENADALGSFTAQEAKGVALQVTAMDAAGAVQTADAVTAEKLNAMKDAVKAPGATITAFAPEGDVMGALSIDENGNASMAKNTLMDATLQQASVTSIALDKLLTNDVRKRLGDIRADKNQTGVWMRWDGGKLQGEGLSNDFNTIQIGGDTKVAKNCRIGVAGSFTHGDAEFARGTAELEGFSLATYATWMGDNGMFADVVARLGQFNNEMSVEGRKGKLDNRVFSLSGEYGWRLPVCEQFFVEPQVELAYTYVSSDTLELGNAKYLIDSVDSLTGRAGLVAGWNLPNDMGNVYARASVLQQFMGDAKISGSVGSATNVQELDGDDTWIEYGIGANVKLTDKTYIWADVERTSGAELDEEWRGTVGIRVSF